MAINNKREATIAITSLLLTLALYLQLGDHLAHRVYDSYFFPNPYAFVEGILYIVSLLLVAYGALLYHGCLIGHYLRMIKHSPLPFEEVEAIYDNTAPAMTVIIPSYKEERIVMWQTMMSAALSEYTAKRVVLLIDDPYKPKNKADIQALDIARALPMELQDQFSAQTAIYREAQHAFWAREQLGTADAANEMWRLAELYNDVAAWLEAEAVRVAEGVAFEELSFEIRFFINTVLLAPAANHHARAQQLRNDVAKNPLSMALITRHYNRLASLFNVQFSSFERKKYVNLPHDANKAMNLNTYITLIGHSWKEIATPEGITLVKCDINDADFTVPAADYVNTIDADSLMTHDYIARLIHHLEQPGNERIAIAQSPCSSIPGSPRPLEYIASASIDAQFHLHQGYTFWDASFWVGANAMLRHTALEEIKEVSEIDGKTVTIYIQDRTLIEDTESTIDLVHKGWKLYNYPARMTFSSMPPDFGSLLIQRRRWANGGLIILPKLLHYAFHAKKDFRLLKELFMRFNYLAMTTLGVVVTFVLILYNFSPRLNTPLLIYANIPLLLLLARDLKVCGYRYTDILRVCALNLLLFPIITAGVLKQMQQIITGRKIPFARTPKVKDRTAAPAIYYFAEFAIIGFFAYGLYGSVDKENWSQVAYSGVTMLFFIYALIRYVGVRAMCQDIAATFRRTPSAETKALKSATQHAH